MFNHLYEFDFEKHVTRCTCGWKTRAYNPGAAWDLYEAHCKKIISYAEKNFWLTDEQYEDEVERRETEALRANAAY